MEAVHLYYQKYNMNTIRYITPLLLLASLWSQSSFGQTKIITSKQQPNTIEYARSILDENPTEAVKILNQIINKKSKRRDYSKISEAYEILGDINQKNGLYKDAATRYKQANEFSLKIKSIERSAELQNKIGSALLADNSNNASSYFKVCMERTNDTKLYYQCYEGYGDAIITLDSVNRSQEIYQEIEKVYKKEKSPSLARIQAKIADTYAAQSQIDKALENYGNAQSNYVVKNKKDDEQLKKSSDNIITNQTDVADEISLRNSNIELHKDRPEKVAEEQIELADVYIRSGKTSSAEGLLNEVKPILSELPASTKADYFKQSSALAGSKGDYKAAIDEYKEYVRYRDSILEVREAQLDQRLNITELQSEIDLSEKEYVNEMDRSAYQKNLVTTQRYIIGLLGLLLLGAISSTLLIYRNVQAKKKANQLLELRSLRSAMNPHFIFNALGSVNNYIAEKDTRKANKYLAEFSKLMRSVLDMNKQDLVPLHEELSLAELYIKLEHNRWSDKFSYSVDIDYDSIPDDMMVPPLLIQPYIENAVWHGLRYKETMGHLALKTYLKNGNYIIDIMDNGIGRTQSMMLKTKNQKQYKSTGLQNTKRRTELINDIYGKNYSVAISDNAEQNDDVGTCVKVELRS